MKLLATSFLVIVTLQGWAQKPDSAEVKVNYLPTGVRIGTDLISLAKIPFSDRFDGWEVSADVDFYKYYFTVEYGSWEKSILSTEQNYTNTGTYFRVGADVNLLLKDPDRNMFFLGLRYARSSFSEKLDYIIADDVFGDLQQSLSNKNMSSGWAEATLGLRVKLWKQLWMGYTARLKIAPSVATDGEFVVYDIPGYGLASKRSYWGFNYQLYWRFPVRKTP